MDLRTYNDDQIKEKSQSVYMKAMIKLDVMLDTEGYNTEEMEALANVASAASNGFSQSDDLDDETQGF